MKRKTQLYEAFYKLKRYADAQSPNRAAELPQNALVKWMNYSEHSESETDLLPQNAQVGKDRRLEKVVASPHDKANVLKRPTKGEKRRKGKTAGLFLSFGKEEPKNVRIPLDML